MRLRTRKAHNESGQSLVEFALVLPVLLLILIGIIEFGWLFNAQITLTSAAREGARNAAVAVINDSTGELSPADKDGLEAAIRNHIQGLSGLTLTTFQVLYNGEYIGLGDVPNEPDAGQARAYVVYVPDAGGHKEVRVFVKGRAGWLTGFFSFISDSIQLSSESVMRKE